MNNWLYVFLRLWFGNITFYFGSNFRNYSFSKKDSKINGYSGFCDGFIGDSYFLFFFIQEPKDIIEQTIININKEREVKTTKTFPKKEKEFIDLSAMELYKFLIKFTGSRQDEEWEKYKGKYVKRAGKLYPFEGPKISNAGVVVRLLTNDNLTLGFDMGPRYLFLKVIFNEVEADKLFDLKKEDIISFTGRLTDAAMT